MQRCYVRNYYRYLDLIHSSLSPFPANTPPFLHLAGPYFKAYFHQPTRIELATMVAILEIGAFITSILAGRVGDIFGRRATILMGATLFTIGGLFQAFTNGFRMMVLGRVLAGNGVGFLR